MRNVTANEKALECEVCEQWFHIICVDCGSHQQGILLYFLYQAHMAHKHIQGLK